MPVAIKMLNVHFSSVAGGFSYPYWTELMTYHTDEYTSDTEQSW